MKIGIDLRCLMEKNISGIGQYILNLLPAILKQDKENEYFLFFNSLKVDKISRPDISGDNVHWVMRRYPNKFLNFGMRFLRYPKIDHLVGKLNVWWSPGNNFITWSKNIHKVVTCHDLSWHIMPRFYSLKGRIWHKLINLQKVYKEADVILAISKNTKNDLIDLNKSLADKIVVTPLGVGLMNIEQKQIEQVEKKMKLPEKFLLYIGNIEPRKNLDSIIDSFLKLQIAYPDLYLVIAGGPGWHQGYYKRILSRAKNQSHIKYLGYVEEVEKYFLYRLAQILVFPSFYEGFGLPPLEAMSQGLPVVASSVSSLPEVVCEGGLLVDPHNVNQIVYAVDRILKDENLRNELIVKGRQISSEYTWQETAKKTLSALGVN